MQATEPPGTHTLDALADALREVLLGVRRAAPGDDHDKAAVGLLSHLVSLGPVRAGDLAERACLDPSTVSRHLKGLEDDGYLLRTPDPDDRRATLIEVSPTGYELVAAARAQRIAVLERAVSAWPSADVRDLTRLAQRLADELAAR
jgi:DNA-binding MarR family transcriptional regulator